MRSLLTARHLLLDAADLVLPARCVGCRRPGSAWCTTCRPDEPPFAVRVRHDPGVAVVAATSYAGAVRAALLARKERDRRDLTAPCARLLGRAAVVAAADPSRPPGPILLVPVPSSRRAVRERHGDHVRVLATGARTGTVVPALRLTRRVRDSAGLGADERLANLQHAMTAVAAARAGPLRPGAAVIVVDDIVTTGATLAEAVRALREAGWPVAAAAVVAAVAPLPGRVGVARRAGGSTFPASDDDTPPHWPRTAAGSNVGPT